MEYKKPFYLIVLFILSALLVAACAGTQGPQGPQGPQGASGGQGEQGPPGEELTEEQLAALETATNLSGIQFPALDEVRRGCPACHALVEDDGKYTLPYEAHERAEIRGNEHPEIAPDGTSLAVTEEVNVTVCLQCHAPGTGDRAGKGVIAPLALRDIVHPAHMYSPWFKFHYGGNCITCHNINGEGEFELLTEMVDVNEKGVPNPENLPIPGAIILHEREEAGEGEEMEEVSVAEGGRLYDKWWKEANADEPAEDNPVWARQDTNTRSGSDTWRCKECHGWDYMGADGAYGSGSHFTGFPGIIAAQEKSEEEILAQLTGEVDVDHDYSAMGEDALSNLVNFIKEGLVDISPYIDAETKAAVGGDNSNGEQLYTTTCVACHGDDGRTLNFGSDEEPDYVGTIALDNPWEFIHKVRAGQPGTPMPSSIDSGWSLQDVIDLLTFSQTLPTEAP